MSKKKVEKFYNKDTNVFTYVDYRLNRFWEAPRKFIRSLKWAFQRVKYGYCDYDTWNIDAWFCKVMSTMLRNFANTTHGYPSFKLQDFIKNKIDSGEIEHASEIDNILADKNCELFNYWQSILNDLADKFDVYNLDFYDTEEYKIAEKSPDFYKKWTDYENMQIESVKDGLDSFKNWFFDLWD